MSSTSESEAIALAHAQAMAREDDGYFDPRTGLFVMTEAYHLNRGACCGNRCRHCPFDYEACD
jgi:hypothetical protein